MATFSLTATAHAMVPYLILAGIPLAVTFLFKYAGDPYGLFHLSLNQLPDESSDASPRTEWLNMGFWQDTNVFPRACEALAKKLIQAAECKKGGAILDVGHGTGESLLLLLSDSSIPRPSILVGITSLPVHHFRTQERVDRLLAASLSDPRPDISLYLGDAVCQPSTFDHPLDPSSKVMFDSILALDCAYHFHTRHTFLRQSLRKLAPGGRIALADICFDPGSLQSRKMRLLSSLFALMPKQNMISADEYVAQLEAMGYVDVKLEDITTDVFPGFIRFLKSRGFGWKMFASFLGWYVNAGARFVLVIMTAIQAVFIPSYEERSFPKPHIVYRIEIQGHVRSWKMWRRYSEFDDLHVQFTKALDAPPPTSLPPKHRFSTILSRTDPKILEERRKGLEEYIRAIISAKEDKWRESAAFKEFLGIPISRQGVGPPTQFTSASWLEEHIELQARMRTIRADINKRDALSDRGDIGASHKANVGAKAKLAGLSTRISTLDKGLEELGMSGLGEGELQRRSDMVARLRDDHEKLTKILTVARETSRTSDSPNKPSSSLETDRETLLGQVSKPVTRIFGAKQPPKETEQTRPLDDHGLVVQQQLQMQEQDDELAQITTILQRQKQLGIAIGNEIGSQIELLDDLSNEVDAVGGKLKNANRQMNKLR